MIHRVDVTQFGRLTGNELQRVIEDLHTRPVAMPAVIFP